MSEHAEHEQWIALAEQDRRALRILLNAPQQPWNAIGFHAQQAAEKYFKAFLVFRGIRPERTHDLGKLLKACLEFDSSLGALVELLDALEYYAVEGRYEHEDEFSEASAREAADASDRICNAIRERLT